LDFLKLIIRITLSIEIETTLLIYIITSYGGPQIKVSFQNIQVVVVIIQQAKKGNELQKIKSKLDKYLCFSFKAMTIMESFFFFIHMNVKEFKQKIHLMKF